MLQAVPALFARFIDYLERSGRDLHAPRLRYLSAGGAPLDIDWKREIERRFGTQLHNGYGLTETASTAGITRIGDNRDDDTIGLPAPGVCDTLSSRPTEQDVRPARSANARSRARM